MNLQNSTGIGHCWGAGAEKIKKRESVTLRKDDAAFGWLAGVDAGAGCTAQLLVVGNTTHGHFEFLLQSLFVFDAAGPVDQSKAAMDLGLVFVRCGEEFPKLVHRLDLDGVFMAKVAGPDGPWRRILFRDRVVQFRCGQAHLF